MAIVTQFPTANEVGDFNTWTNPNNAHADDAVDATTTHLKAIASSQSTDNRFFNFGFDGVLPTGASISLVRIYVEWGNTVVTSAENYQIRTMAIISGVNQTERIIDSPGLPVNYPQLDVNDHTADRAWTRTDLLDANFKVRVRAFTADTVNGFETTYQLDYVKVEVTYTAPLPSQDWGNWSDSAQPIPGPSIDALPWTGL